MSVEQPDGHRGLLVLWGTAVQWLPRFRHNKGRVHQRVLTRKSEPGSQRRPPPGAVWNFRNLLVREGVTSDLPELHSTPWSSVQALDPADPRAQEFIQRRPRGTSIELDLDTLLSQKYSGRTGGPLRRNRSSGF